MSSCERYPGREPGEWVWDVKMLCVDLTCEYHHPEDDMAKVSAGYAITGDGEKVDTVCDVEVITREDGTVKRVLIDGLDMTYKIAADGLTIRPGSNGWRTRVDLTLVARTVTYRTE